MKIREKPQGREVYQCHKIIPPMPKMDNSWWNLKISTIYIPISSQVLLLILSSKNIKEEWYHKDGMMKCQVVYVKWKILHKKIKLNLLKIMLNISLMLNKMILIFWCISYRKMEDYIEDKNILILNFATLHWSWVLTSKIMKGNWKNLILIDLLSGGSILRGEGRSTSGISLRKADLLSFLAKWRIKSRRPTSSSESTLKRAKK